MEQVHFTGFLNPLTPIVLLLLLFVLVIWVLSPFSKTQQLPPGPKPWPVVGNILQLGQKPHLSLTNLAKVHGPLISLRLGTQLIVVASSPMAVTEILKTHDRLLFGRKLPRATPYEPNVIDRVSIVWASECSKQWKSLRALCKTELFSVKAVELGCLEQPEVLRSVEELAMIAKVRKKKKLKGKPIGFKYRRKLELMILGIIQGYMDQTNEVKDQMDEARRKGEWKMK